MSRGGEARARAPRDPAAALDAAQTPGALGDMAPEDLRRHGRRVVDWVADYMARVGDRPVLARTRPGELRRSLPPAPPERPESVEAILDDLDRLLLPGITHWNSPGFMAYFGISGSGPGVLGELISAALNVNAMLWRTSPAATELEEVALDWLRQAVGLPEPRFGVINDTASTGVLVALAAARHALDGGAVREQGLAAPGGVGRLRYYTSEEAHSSVEKAGIVLGLGRDGCRRLGVDGAFRLDAAQLARAVAEDRAAGWRPFAVVATVGTTSTTSVDPVAAIAELCRRERLWLHVDAAYAGVAAVDPAHRWALDGCAAADSLVVNPHKWLFTPIDCSVLWTRHPEVLRAAFSLVPEYLRSAEQDDPEAPNLMDYGVALGRRFRALKLWMVMRYFGREGLAARIAEHCRLAGMLVELVEADADFEMLAPAPFSTVCFRARPAGVAADEAALDRLNGALIDAVNAGGEAFVSHTRLGGRLAIRAAIGNLGTGEEHVRRLWSLLREALGERDGARSP